MKLTFKQKIFCSFVLLFAIFAVILVLEEQREEKRYKTEALENQLDNYAEIIHASISLNSTSANQKMAHIDSLANILPASLRVTVVNENGGVLYDNDVKEIKNLDNHLERPEIMKALHHGNGSHIRFSTSTKHEYIYYAKHYRNYYIRVALPYNVEVQNILTPDRFFIYIVIGLFIIMLVLLNYMSARFSKSIVQLKKFATDVKDDKPLPESITFPDDELGEIGEELAHIFQQKEEHRQEIEKEKNKLLQHFQYSDEGLSIYGVDFKKIYANTKFIQYLNLISDKPILDANEIEKEPIFSELFQFLKGKTFTPYYSTKIEKNGKIIQVQAVVFADRSFEITLKDISKVEKNRLLKQEMTNNIAHELKTPVTSLRGYLETLVSAEIPLEKQSQFIHKAYNQSIRLSNLIEDVSLLSKIGESTSNDIFKVERLNILQVVNDVRIDLTGELLKHGDKLHVNIPTDAIIQGNYTLLYSIFKNLISNSITHGGDGVEIFAENYKNEDGYFYFSFYDTGKGVGEHHLPRLFERFYRTDDGRTRDNGGSGLGLSIVKNAVMHLGGEIQARIHPGAGLGFLFTLKA